MDLILAFLSGLSLAAIVSYFMAKSIIQNRENNHKESMASMQKVFDETISRVSAQVKTDTNEMLKARQKEFAESSSSSIGQIVTPLRDNIAELKKALEEGNKEQADRSGEMRAHIRNLMEQSNAARKSAEQLAAALRHGNKVQGDWGEAALVQLLNSQGLTEGIHFHTQCEIKDAEGKAVRTEDGKKLRPDVILHLDQKREVIIDSKVSLSAYMDYVNSDNEADKQRYLKAHIESLRKHIKELSGKDYSSYVCYPKVAAGYVIMFVPNIGALWTALDAEPSLWRQAADANVYIADEQSLYGALKIVSMTWTQVAQAQNHEKVFALANEMIDRVGQFMKYYKALGASLVKAQNEYEAAQKKLSPSGQSILTTSRKLLELGAKDSDKQPIKPYIDIDNIPQLTEE